MSYTWTATLWNDDIPPVDHAPIGLARLIWKYRGDHPRIQAFLEAFLDEVQSLEDVAYDVLTGVWPWTAVGDQLDVLGRIVGQRRFGLVDNAYRIFILGRIFVNKADGRIVDYFDLLADILGVEQVDVYEWWPAAFRISVAGVDYTAPTIDLVFDMKGGGIYLEFLYSEQDEGTIFTTSSQLATDEASTTEGTENLAMTSGGYLSSMRWYR
jgi:hypothetical protein